MLAKNTAIYFLGRGIPGLINFMSISIFTGFIAPSEYGKYAIAFAIISFFNTIFFSWIRLSSVRYYPIAVDNSELPSFYSSIGGGFLVSTFFSCLIFIILYYTEILKFENKIFPLLIILGILFQGFFEIGLEYFVSSIKPLKYSLSFFIKAIFNFLIGYFLIMKDFGGLGLLMSLIISLIISVILFFLPFIKSIWLSRKNFNIHFFKSFILFGLPFTISYGMVYIFNMFDRFFLDHYLGKNITGIYSVSFDLSRQTLWIFFTSISLAGFPLALKHFQQNGNHEGLNHMEKNFTLLITICTPLALGLAFLAKDFTEVFVGASYRQGVQELIPILSIGTLFLGVKNFYFDQSFQISKRTILQIIPVAVAATISITLNLLLIPTIGIKGAAYSSLFSFLAGLIMSIWLSQITFALPIPFFKTTKVLLSNLFMLITLYIISSIFNGLSSLVMSLIFGGFVYLASIHLLGVLNLKDLLFQIIKRN